VSRPLRWALRRIRFINTLAGTMRRNRRVLLALGLGLGLATTMIAGACGSDGGGGDSASGSGSAPDVHSMLLDGTGGPTVTWPLSASLEVFSIARHLSLRVTRRTTRQHCSNSEK
jgi:hypothetical protein